MRFKLSLQKANHNQNTLPINYQYEISAWIYHTIHHADPIFARWLHEQGYTQGNQRFKFFTFSNLVLPHGSFRIHGDRIILDGNSCDLIISFLIDAAAEPFITGLFAQQEFTLGDKLSKIHFKVVTVEQLPAPSFAGTMEFKTLSPVLVSKSRYSEGGSGTAYLAPDHEDYERLFFQNLQRKARIHSGTAAIIQDFSCKLEITSSYKMKGITIKAHTEHATKVIGYMYKFKIQAPAEWIKTGYYAGFGEKNSEGMGCVEKC
jgi:CRISPR-associated endoribonuclease Cas6